MATQAIPGKVSFAEYLDFERQADTKHEFRGGEIYAMSGGTLTHARLSAKIIFLLSRSLSQSCQVFSSDLKIYAATVNEGMYPDVSLLCGEPEFYDGRRDILLNPTVVCEVLSPSTREYDQSLKASFYRAIPSLQTIILLDSETIYAQRQARHGGGWLLDEWTSPDGVLPIIQDVSVALREIYEGILL